METEWERLRSRDSDDNFAADASGIVNPRTCFAEHKKYNTREHSLLKDEIR